MGLRCRSTHRTPTCSWSTCPRPASIPRRSRNACCSITWCILALDPTCRGGTEANSSGYPSPSPNPTRNGSRVHSPQSWRPSRNEPNRLIGPDACPRLGPWDSFTTLQAGSKKSPQPAVSSQTRSYGPRAPRWRGPSSSWSAKSSTPRRPRSGPRREGPETEKAAASKSDRTPSESSLALLESYLALARASGTPSGVNRVGKSEYLNFVNGEWVSSHTEDTYTVINPATGGTIAAVPQSDLQDTRAAIDAAREAFDKGKWPRLTPGDRAAALFKLANLIEAEMDRLGPLESQNQGKTIKQARDGDLPFSVDNLRFMAGAARTLTGQASMEYAYGATSLIRREPIGVIGQITPWNYPFMMAIWKLAPALAAGNTAVLKPASLTPLTTLELGKLIEAAGIPAGTVNLITGPGAVVGNELASSDKVDMVSLTGDTATGKEIMKAATSNVKKLHLELGGKAPFVVFEDANIAAAAEGAVAASMVNV